MSWVEVELTNLEEDGIDQWIAVLEDDESDNGITVPMNAMQATHLTFSSMTDMLSSTIFPTIYQSLLFTAVATGHKPKRVVIDSKHDYLVHGRLEFEGDKGSFWINLEGADVVILATVADIPIFTLKGLLEEIEDDEEENDHEGCPNCGGDCDD